jgi:hypothetical protein
MMIEIRIAACLLPLTLAIDNTRRGQPPIYCHEILETTNHSILPPISDMVLILIFLAYI